MKHKIKLAFIQQCNYLKIVCFEHWGHFAPELFSRVMFTLVLFSQQVNQVYLVCN